jgi:selenocysteine-specific elongation factor
MIIGTAGHIDHGKSSLVRAITGVDPDRLKEEKARGITIDLGFAYWPQPDGSVIGFVDVPGHERFVHTMLAGAHGIDLVLLAVAADDGIMPQTVEHLAILKLLGLERGIVALTKADLVDGERLAEVTARVREAVAGTGLADAPVIPVSVVDGHGLDGLKAALIAAAHNLPRRARDHRFRLSVDRSFTLAGTGTVVTGTVLDGHVSVGDEVVVSPSGLNARIRGVRAQNRPVERAVAGDRCALNLAGPGVTKDAIRRGDMVLDPMLHAPTARIDAELDVLAGEPRTIGTWLPVWLHHAAAEVAARIVPLGDPVPPGGTGLVQLVLEAPIAARALDRFVLRDTSQTRTIGGGRLLDLRAPERRRRSPERFAILAAQAIADPAGSLQALLARSPFVVDLDAFGRDRGLTEATLAQFGETLSLIRLPVGEHLHAIGPAAWLTFKRALLAALAEWHGANPDLPGIGLERLRLQIEPRFPAPLFRAALQGLARNGEVALQAAWVRLPSHEVRLTADDQALWGAIGPMMMGTERFRPPRVRDIAGLLGAEEARVRKLCKLLSRKGELDEVAPDHFFLRPVVAEMVGVAADLAATSSTPEFTAAQFRDRLDNGRKVAIQILEFFDRHGVTIRRGDLRRINRHRLDLFGSAEAAMKDDGREAGLVAGPDFKSGRGREPVSGGFDSHSLPPRDPEPAR